MTAAEEIGTAVWLSFGRVVDQKCDAMDKGQPERWNGTINRTTLTLGSMGPSMGLSIGQTSLRFIMDKFVLQNEWFWTQELLSWNGLGVVPWWRCGISNGTMTGPSLWIVSVAVTSPDEPLHRYYLPLGLRTQNEYVFVQQIVLLIFYPVMFRITKSCGGMKIYASNNQVYWNCRPLKCPGEAVLFVLFLVLDAWLLILRGVSGVFDPVSGISRRFGDGINPGFKKVAGMAQVW